MRYNDDRKATPNIHTYDIHDCILGNHHNKYPSLELLYKNLSYLIIIPRIVDNKTLDHNIPLVLKRRLEAETCKYQ